MLTGLPALIPDLDLGRPPKSPARSSRLGWAQVFPSAGGWYDRRPGTHLCDNPKWGRALVVHIDDYHPTVHQDPGGFGAGVAVRKSEHALFWIVMPSSHPDRDAFTDVA